MFDRKKSFSSFLLFFAVGAVAGAAAALLYAPMTGRKMQKKVSNITDKVADRLIDKVDDLKVAVRRVATA
jgi:gas vesicle protein